jgi:aspartate kinase
MITTSEIRISVIVRSDDVPIAVAALHSSFDLDAADEVATVYGGTGR